MKKVLTSVLLVLLLLGVFLPTFVAPHPVYASSTETLRPNAAGDETSITYQSPDSTYHWDKVDEAVADDNTTFVYTLYSASYKRDLYHLPAPSGSGVINSITIYFCIRGDGVHWAYARPSQKSGTTVTDGSEVSRYLATFYTFSQTYTSNPATGLSYTWDEIDNLQIGCQLKCLDADGGAVCTQVYVVIDYTPPAIPAITTNAASSVEEATATLNGEVTAINDTEITDRGFVWDTSTHGAPGNVAPASSGYANNWTQSDSYSTGAFFIVQGLILKVNSTM